MPASGPILALLVAGATFIGGYYLGSMAGQKAGYSQGAMEKTEELKAKVKASGEFVMPTALHSLSGSITAVHSDGFELKAGNLQRNPLEESTPSMRSVKVTSSTKIQLMVPRDFAEFDAAQKEYVAAMQKAAGKPEEKTMAAPLPFRYEDIKLSDLKEGTIVNVTSASEISTATSFEATEVQVQPAQPQPPLPPQQDTPPTAPTR